MNRIRWMTAGIIALAALSFMSCSFLSVEKEEKNTYRTAMVERRDIRSSVLATGIIKPKVGAEVRVGSRVSGIVQTLHANVGDMIRKGDLIAELDPTELQAKYDQVQASLATARADYEYAKTDLERQRRLHEKNFISQNQVDLAEKSFQIKKSQYEQVEANLAFAWVQLEYTRIQAPISGVVASVSTQEGETVAASFAAPTFVTIIDLNRLEVRAYVDETDIGRVQVGQKATFTVDTYRDTDFEGTVTAIYPQAEIQDNVVNYIATIDIDDFQGKTLRPEMTTTVTIYLDNRDDVLAVPTSALQREQGGMVVTIPGPKEPQKQLVQTGWSSGGYTEITGGLKQGDEVIIR